MSTTPPQPKLNDPVGRHIRTDFTRIDVDETVGDALARLRREQPPGRIIYFYVTDRDGRLRGVVPTRRLLLSAPESPVRDVMVANVIAIPATATVIDACEFFIFHKLLAFPVVDAEGRMLGLVDIDLYTGELTDLDQRTTNDDLFQLIGVHLAESQQANPVAAFRQRFPWLLCNVAGGILAAFLSGLFEAELQKVVALALFVPVVLALAESVAIQSVSLALQTLHGERPTWAALFTKLRREGLTGILLGMACGGCVALVGFVWIGQGHVALCLLGGIAGGVTAAAVVGVAVPYLLRLARLDPRVAAGPVALAAADMLTLLVYFNLARWLFG